MAVYLFMATSLCEEELLYMGRVYTHSRDVAQERIGRVNFIAVTSCVCAAS